MSRRGELQFHERYPEVIAAWAEKYGRPIEMIEDWTQHYFWAIRFCMENEATPIIKVGKMGSFKLAVGPLKAGITSIIRKYRRGEVTREYTNEYIRRIWPKLRQAQRDSAKKKDRLMERRPDAQKEGWDRFVADAPHERIAFWRRNSLKRKGYRRHVKSIKKKITK